MNFHYAIVVVIATMLKGAFRHSCNSLKVSEQSRVRLNSLYFAEAKYTFKIETQELKSMLLEDRRRSFETSIRRLKSWTKIDTVNIRLKAPGNRKEKAKKKFGEVIFEVSGTPSQVQEIDAVLNDDYFEKAFLWNDKTLLLYY